MSIIIKTEEQIEKMRIAGELASQVLIMIESFIEVGITTNKLNEICHNFIVNEQKAIPAPLNYNGFPKSICTSINHVVCHGIPDNRVLENGDILNIDITVKKDGYHGDTSKMFIVGDASAEGKKICNVAQVSMYEGIKILKPGVQLGDVGYIIKQYAESNGYSVVRDYCGHGIGEVFHEPPMVLHYGKPNTMETIEKGMIFTIEPMINVGKKDTLVLEDGWTVITKDMSFSAQYEHTILITEDGYEILTLRDEEIGWEKEI